MNKADLVKQWFSIAADDLRSAAFLFGNLYPKPIDIICYHCQQTVEKALKGYLIDQDMEPPYTHDLNDLLILCKGYDSSYDTLEEICQKLTNFATATRYPSPIEILEADALYALEKAENAFAFCVALVPALHLERPNEQEQENKNEQAMEDTIGSVCTQGPRDEPTLECNQEPEDGEA